jgi:hypothetical protein
VTTTLNAPFSLTPVALSTSYLGNSDYLVIGARKLYIGLFEDGTGLVDGTCKLRIGLAGSVEIPIPADNMLPFDLSGGECIPAMQIDVKAGAGTPTLILLAF